MWVTSACGESSGALAVPEKEQKELQLEGAAYQWDKKAFLLVTRVREQEQISEFFSHENKVRKSIGGNISSITVTVLHAKNVPTSRRNAKDARCETEVPTALPMVLSLRQRLYIMSLLEKPSCGYETAYT